MIEHFLLAAVWLSIWLGPGIYILWYWFFSKEARELRESRHFNRRIMSLNDQGRYEEAVQLLLERERKRRYR